jgi:hypothetical protein
MKRFMHNTNVLHYLLLLCLWQGPMPVWHAHGTLADAPEASRAWLAGHLETHHTAVDPCELVFFGWHVHFEVPDAEGDPDDAPRSILSFPLVLGSNADAVRPMPGAFLSFVGDALVFQEAFAGGGVPSTTRFARRGFFPDDAASLPLPLRIGVARC